MRRYTAITTELLGHRLTELLLARHDGRRPLRVALDAPIWVRTEPLVDELRTGLLAAGHPVGVVQACDFYRDASLRFEYGKTDVESFYTGWLDRAALQREVLDPVAATEDAHYLPALRDPATNRAIRTRPQPLSASGVLLVRGELLLGAGLGFDVAVHLAVSRAARKRQVPQELSWTLPAFDRYDIDVNPAALADVVIRYDDPAHPAMSVR
ncbi:MAG: hypothetical protein QOE23_3762 [Pseudonocardiales bacterium]|nr:hypothetical protein [Pseudonocardiales bacterium]